MSQRARPAVLAVLLVVALIGVITLLGIGPFASDSGNDVAQAPATTPAPAVVPSPAVAGTTVTGTTPGSTTPDGTTPNGTTPATKHHAKSSGSSTSTSSGAGSTSGGNANPLVVITEPNRQAFERSVVKLTNLNQAPGGPTKPMLSAAHAACARLASDPKLAAGLRSDCTQTIRVAKASSKMRKLCQQAQDTNCAVAAQRLATTTAVLVDTRRTFASTVRASVPAGGCRKVLLPTHSELVGLKRLAKALNRLAKAVAIQDKDKMASAATAVDDAGRTSGADARPAETIITQFRTACHLKQYPDFN